MVDRFLETAPPAPARTFPSELEKTARKETRGKKNRVFRKALDKAITYIPTEVVTTYIAILDLFRDAEKTWVWAIFWFFLAMTPIAVWVTYVVKAKWNPIQLLLAPGRWPWGPMVAATVAFVAWAAAVPGSVMKTLAWFRPGFGMAAVILATFLIGLFSQLGGSRAARG
jgi:hypothetical protein